MHKSGYTRLSFCTMWELVSDMTSRHELTSVIIL